jgi:hypothetical protein
MKKQLIKRQFLSIKTYALIDTNLFIRVSYFHKLKNKLNPNGEYV